MRPLFLCLAICVVSGLYFSTVFALNEESKAILDRLYEEGRGASKEELMEMLTSIAGDERLTRKKKVKEMDFILHLVGGRLSDEEKRKARAAAFKAVDRMRAEAFLMQHPELEEGRREAIRAGRLEKGMSKEEVEATLGLPEKITRVLRNPEFDERWDYYSKRLVVYFSGNRLHTWKDSGG